MQKTRWLMIWMCFLVGVVAYFDRANLAIAAPIIGAELGLNPAQIGLVLSAFFWSYAAMQLPAGPLVDKFGDRASLTFAVMWWSVFTMFTGLAQGMSQMVGARLMLGAGEAAGLPCCIKTASNWFPRPERGFACGIFSSGTTVGSALSLPLVATLIGLVGWRGSFMIVAIFGVALALAWWFISKDVERYRDIAPAQVDAVLAAQSASPHTIATVSISWLDLFRYRTIWGLMIGLFCLNFAIYFFITWFPSYLLHARGFSLASLRTWGAMPALMAVVGSWLGGYTSDFLLRRGWSPTRARKTCLVGGMLMASVIGISAFVDNTAVCLALFSIAYASLAFAGTNVWTVGSEIAPTPHHVASISGIQNFAGNLAGIVITNFTGVMLFLTKGSFLIPLTAAGALCVLGALSYLFVVGKVEPLPQPRGA